MGRKLGLWSKKARRYGIDNIKLTNSGRGYARMIVRMRDDFKCHDCGKRRTPRMLLKMNEGITGLKGRSKLFDCHHIDGRCGKNSRGIDSVREVENMITLCHKCHYNRPEHKVKRDDFGSRKLSIKLHAKIKKMFKTMSAKNIAKEMGVSSDIIYKIVNN